MSYRGGMSSSPRRRFRFRSASKRRGAEKIPTTNSDETRKRGSIYCITGFDQLSWFGARQESAGRRIRRLFYSENATSGHIRYVTSAAPETTGKAYLETAHQEGRSLPHREPPDAPSLLHVFCMMHEKTGFRGKHDMRESPGGGARKRERSRQSSTQVLPGALLPEKIHRRSHRCGDVACRVTPPPPHPDGGLSYCMIQPAPTSFSVGIQVAPPGATDTGPSHR